jgi:hypothetical protein
VTTLIEEMRIAVQGLLQAIGLGASANTAATVVPVLVLGVALNLIALHVVDRVHPLKEKTQVVDMARAELKFVQTMTASVLREIGGRERGRSSVKGWASSRLAHCGSATGLGRAVGRGSKGGVSPCGGHSSSVNARRTLRAI